MIGRLIEFLQQALGRDKLFNELQSLVGKTDTVWVKAAVKSISETTGVSSEEVTALIRARIHDGDINQIVWDVRRLCLDRAYRVT